MARATDEPRRQALAHYVGMLDYIIKLTTAYARLVRRATLRWAFRTALRNHRGRPEAHLAAREIQRLYRAYRVRVMFDLVELLREQVYPPTLHPPPPSIAHLLPVSYPCLNRARS